MIIVRIKTGLGSQLFQYSTARRLAHVNNARLLLDVSSFETNTCRRYRLAHFDIDADIATEADISLFSDIEWLNDSQDRFRIKERYHHFDPNILTLRGDIYLDGFWQSERYFFDIQDLLKKELVIVTKSSYRNRKLAAVIRDDPNSVSLHIRRGDHVSNPFVNQTHGLLSLNYYDAAVKHIKRYIRHPHFYVFSDEPNWVCKNFTLDEQTTFVDINDTDKAYEDLRLMSLCKHHIIANSSLSWWGAWLSRYPKKIIYAPKSWFVKKDLNSEDLIPSSWKRL